MIKEFMPHIVIPRNTTSNNIIDFKILFSRIFKYEKNILTIFCYMFPTLIIDKYTRKICRNEIKNSFDVIFLEFVMGVPRIFMCLLLFDGSFNLYERCYNGIVICSTNITLICYLLIKKILLKYFMNMLWMDLKYLKYYSSLINNLLFILLLHNIREIIYTIKEKKNNA